MAYVGIGGNEGDRTLNLLRGMRLIGLRCPVVALSSIYLTEAWGFSSRPFLNAVLLVRCDGNPFSLFQYLKYVERILGRVEGTSGYSPRPFDADLLLYEGLTLTSPVLTVPHPRMHLRSFVMVPLRELWARGLPTLGFEDRREDTGYVRRVMDHRAISKVVLK